MGSEDHRVNIKTKKHVCKQLQMYHEVLTKVLDGQSEISDEMKQLLLQEFLRNFDIGVQESIVINGESWEDAPDGDKDTDCKTLDDMLDENILETTLKRSRYPKKILPYVVRSLKAEREAMGLYEQAIKAQEIKKDPVQGAIMNSLAETVPKRVRQARDVMKSLQTLKRKAEGLRQVLAMQHCVESTEIHRQVFCSPPGTEMTSVDRRMESRGSSLKRSLQEMQNNDIYVLN